MKYDEVNMQVLQRSRDNDDVVMEVLNLFALFLNQGDYQNFEELPEVKIKLNSAMEQYQILLDAIHNSNKNYDLEMMKQYKILTDKYRDNIQE